MDHKKISVLKHPEIVKAYEELERLSADEDVQFEYYQREKALMDYTSFIKDSFTEGKIEGREEGKEEGIKEGQEAGKEEKQIEIIKTMSEQGLSADMIAKYTGIELAEVKTILE